MKELISGMENLPEFQGMGDNIQTILEKFVKIDQNLFMEIIEKRSSSSHVFTIPESTNLRIFEKNCKGRSFLFRSKIPIYTVSHKNRHFAAL